MEDIPNELISLTEEIIEKSQKLHDTVSDPFLAYGFDAKLLEKLSFKELNQLINLEKKTGTSVLLTNLTKFTTLISQLSKFRETNNPRDAIIVSSRDSGTTTLINKSIMLIERTKASKKRFHKIVIFDAKNHMTSSLTKTSVASLVHYLRKEIATYEDSDNVGVVLIDHADYIAESFVLFYDSIKFQLPDKSFIFVFSPPAWLRLKSYSISMGIDYYENFFVTRFTPTTAKTVLNTLKIKFSSGDKILPPFTIEVLEKIANTSYGSIKSAIKLTKHLCEECFYNNVTYANNTMVKDLAALMGLNHYQDLLNIVQKEDLTRLTILAIIAIKSIGFEVGATYEEIIENLELQKSTISYYLSQLEKKGLVSKRRINRRAFYRLNALIAPFLDRIIIPKFEEQERYVKLQNLPENF